MDPQTTTKESAREEYLDISVNLRHYSSMRFALLTLFTAIQAGLALAVFGDQLTLAAPINTAMQLGGAAAALIFWVMEWRACRYYKRFRERAILLESGLGFDQYSNCPRRGIITSTKAVGLLYFLVIAFWIGSVFV